MRFIVTFDDVCNMFKHKVSLAPFSLFRGLNLSVANHQNPGKTQEKMKLTLG